MSLRPWHAVVLQISFCLGWRSSVRDEQLICNQPVGVFKSLRQLHVSPPKAETRTSARLKAAQAGRRQEREAGRHESRDGAIPDTRLRRRTLAPARPPVDIGEVAKRSNATDCKSVAPAASKVRILPSPPAFARERAEASFGSAEPVSAADRGSVDAIVSKCTSNGEMTRRGLCRAVAARRSERVGGSNSVVESQPSKLLVAGSIPVSRSNLRSPLGVELRLASQCNLAGRGTAAFDPSARRKVVWGTSRGWLAAGKGNEPPRRRGGASGEGWPTCRPKRRRREGRCSSVGRARPW